MEVGRWTKKEAAKQRDPRGQVTRKQIQEREILVRMFRHRISSQGFPGGAVVENLPANAGGHGFEPWSGKTPHAAEQLGP